MIVAFTVRRGIRRLYIVLSIGFYAWAGVSVYIYGQNNMASRERDFQQCTESRAQQTDESGNNGWQQREDNISVRSGLLQGAVAANPL